MFIVAAVDPLFLPPPGSILRPWSIPRPTHGERRGTREERGRLRFRLALLTMQTESCMLPWLLCTRSHTTRGVGLHTHTEDAGWPGGELIC